MANVKQPVLLTATAALAVLAMLREPRAGEAAESSGFYSF